MHEQAARSPRILKALVRQKPSFDSAFLRSVNFR